MKKREAERSPVAIGLMAVAVGALLVFSPLVLGARFTLNKYVVAAGIVALCLGSSLLLHAAIDAVRGRSGGKS